MCTGLGRVHQQGSDPNSTLVAGHEGASDRERFRQEKALFGNAAKEAVEPIKLRAGEGRNGEAICDFGFDDGLDEV